MKVRRAAIALAILAIGVVSGWWLRGFFEIDACLDAGGRWEYGGGYCGGVHLGAG